MKKQFPDGGVQIGGLAKPIGLKATTETTQRQNEHPSSVMARVKAALDLAVHNGQHVVITLDVEPSQILNHVHSVMTVATR